MKNTEYTARTELDVDAQELYAWHARPGAFERLAPPWQDLEVVRREGSITDGSVLEFKVKQGPFAMTWEAHHDQHVEGQQFRDVQRRGPFSHWAHVHRFEDLGPGRSALDDRVEYRLPLGPLGKLFGGWATRRFLDQMFDFRHRRTMDDVMRHKTYADRPRQKVAITGASGLVGTALSSFLTTGGHEVLPVVRRDAREGQIFWKPSDGEIDAAGFEGLDAVVHLAGENIAGRRWNEEHKQRVMESRRQGTRLLCEALAGLERKPRVLLSTSAIGIYGDRGDEVLTEDSAHGDLFLSEVCEAWEEETAAAEAAGIRVVHLRIGLVMTAKGGVLGQVLTLFKLGGGGKLGSGDQYMSWVALDDVVGAIQHALFDEEMRGPVNVVGPAPVTNAAWTKTLGKVLGRPTIAPAPAFALRAALGRQMADELLLASQRVLPKRLEEAGFQFSYPTLESAFRHTLGK